MRDTAWDVWQQSPGGGHCADEKSSWPTMKNYSHDDEDDIVDSKDTFPDHVFAMKKIS